MNLLTVGDSFTYGEELPDRAAAWPNVLGAMLGAAVTNLGQPAASNDAIVRRTIEHTVNTDITPEIVVIGWASPGRIEFADEQGTYSIWPGYSGNVFSQDGLYWRKEIVTYISKYHNMDYLFEKYLQQIVMLQSFLTLRSIPYIMVNVAQNEFYHKHNKVKSTNYIKTINQANFLGFGKEGMMEWAYGCANGPNGHFLEDGHNKVAAKIHNYIKDNSIV